MTVCKRLLLFSTCVCSLWFGLARAQSPETHWVRILQDERNALPFTAIATIDPADALLYRMTIASDIRADRIAKQQAAVGDALVSAAPSESVDYGKVRVTLIQPNLTKRKLRADSNGLLRLASLLPGVNIIVATGAKTHGVQTIFVKPRGENDPAEAAEDPPRTMSLVSATVREVLPVVENYAPDRAANLGGIEDISRDVTGGNDFRHQVELTKDRELTGELVSVMKGSESMADTNVVLFRQGTIVARALTDERGRFVFPNIQPDVYGIIAAGSAGYAAFSFEAVESSGIASSLPNGQGQTFVSLRPNALATPTLPVVVVPPPMVADVVETIQDDYSELDQEGEGAPSDLGQGTGGGPGAGGGGGGSGGGIGGGAAAAAALAAAAAGGGSGGGFFTPITSPVLPGATGPGAAAGAAGGASISGSGMATGSGD